MKRRSILIMNIFLILLEQEMLIEIKEFFKHKYDLIYKNIIISFINPNLIFEIPFIIFSKFSSFRVLSEISSQYFH